MINLESKQVVFLAPIEEVRNAFMSKIRQETHQLTKGDLMGDRRKYARSAVEFFIDNFSSLKNAINETSLQALVETCDAAGRGLKNRTETETAAGRKLNSAQLFYDLVGVIKPAYSDKVDAVFARILRIVLISLWSKGYLILPRYFALGKGSDDMVKIAESIPAPFFYRALAMNKATKLEFPSGVSEAVKRNAGSHWCRLILNTNWTTQNNVTEEDIRELIEQGSGKVGALLGRYYVNEFLSYMFREDEDLLAIYRKVLSEITQQRKEKARKAKTKSHSSRKAARRNEKGTEHTKIAQDSTRDRQLFLDFYQGNSGIEIAPIFSELSSSSVSRVFFRKDLQVDEHPLYSQLDDKVKSLVTVIFHTFEAYRESKRVIQAQPYHFDCALLLSYVSIYLPRFFMVRDGDLSEFPTTLNEFTCAYFVVRNEHLSVLLKEQKDPPLSFFNYVEAYADRFEWDWNTSTYAHLKRFDGYFTFLEDQGKRIPNGEKFRNTITDGDIPKTSRRSSTNKNLIPREYFRAFLSLLEALDYCVDHINGMLDGINPGIVDGELVSPSYVELVSQTHWRSLFGQVRIDEPIDTSILNYTPVVLWEGQYHPLKQIISFYGMTRYRVNGEDQTRATPHAPRILWLMANTGIRQAHLIWLNKDVFDSAVTSRAAALAPLIVSTDKAHDEWVSVVSKEVIEVCRRQREWLERNELESLKEPMWYKNSPKNKFGKFIPLFRTDAGHTSWEVHDYVGRVMWMLEMFLRHQVGVSDCPSLAYWKPSKQGRFPGKAEDHIKTADEFNREDVDWTWSWKLYSNYTAHGLRASFVSEHMRFLPPSLVGRHLTGQFSESLVWYYTIMDAEDVGDHQQLLINLLMKNEDKIQKGGAPDLAEKIADINRIIAKDIDTDPENAVSTHGLFSLSDVDDSKNGVAALKAKQTTQLAFNPTHICPFNNICPSEVVRKFGLGKPCSICPYAIRGVMHLPALNAAKFKCVENMEAYLEKIKAYKKRPRSGVIQAEIEQLEAEHDRLARDAFALEAIEQQLYHMRNADNQSYIAQDSHAIKDLYEKLDLNEGEHLIKRLIDAQTFPDLDSPKLQKKFAYLRYKLMVKTGDIAGLLQEHEEPENALLASQLHSIMAANELTVRDVYRIATTDLAGLMDDRPVLPKVGFDQHALGVTESEDNE